MEGNRLDPINKLIEYALTLKYEDLPVEVVGTIKNRIQVLNLLRELPPASMAADEEVLSYVEARKLWGRGVGWVDVHLLASALLSHARLWTFDKRLRELTSEWKLQQ